MLKRLKYKMAGGLLLAVLVTAWPAQGFAAAVQTAAVPASMTYTVVNTLDVSITTEIQLTGNNLTTELDVTDIEITNNGTESSIQIDSVEVESVETPWTLVSGSTDFAGLKADQYQLALMADGSDLSSGALVPVENVLDPLESRTINMEGRTGVCSSGFSDQKAATLLVTLSEVVVESDEQLMIITGNVPKGGTYTTADGEVIEAGSPMPETPSDGDSLEYRDYIYRYNMTNGRELTIDTTLQGWNAQILDTTKASYEGVSQEIQGKPINSIEYCYRSCLKMETAPVIPTWITRMTNAFENCTKLSGEVVINANPTVYNYAFINTFKPITIVGTCSTDLKAALAATAGNHNVTYA